MLATSAALIAKLFDVGIRFARPTATAGEFGGQFDLGIAADLPDPAAPPVNHPAGRFFLVRTDKGISALYKVCTHLSCLLTWDDQTKAFVCPCHGSQFGRDGELRTGPASRSLDQFVIQLVGTDGQVIAQTDPQQGGPIAIPGRAPAGASVSRGETPGAATPGADEAAAEDEDDASAAAALKVIVDTGRLIAGRPGAAGAQRGS
jgi:cytochrome b6-f complex iron-sulfur subunit